MRGEAPLDEMVFPFARRARALASTTPSAGGLGTAARETVGVIAVGPRRGVAMVVPRHSRARTTGFVPTPSRTDDAATCSADAPASSERQTTGLAWT